MASYVTTLSQAGILGGDEDKILWLLPLERGLQYQHAALLLAGARTVEPVGATLASYDDIVASLRTHTANEPSNSQTES